MIRLDEVRKVYARGDQPTLALNGVSLHIKSGEFVSLLGPSGSGKSTLLHLIGALDNPTSGRVFVDEQELSAMSDGALTLMRRRRLGFVFQFFNLLTTMTAVENVMLPALLCGDSERDAMARASGLLGRVGLGQRLQHRPDQLSGGEMQRVALARALINSPVVLLADEPTGNLDSRTGVEVLKMLREATAERGVTVVMVTHDAAAAAVGDRMVHLQDGKVVHDEPTAHNERSRSGGV